MSALQSAAVSDADLKKAMQKPLVVSVRVPRGRWGSSVVQGGL